MRFVRSAMVDFQTEEDLKEYVEVHKVFMSSFEKLEQIIIYQTGPTSIQAILIYEDAEALQKDKEKTAKWREEQNFKGVVDTILHQGDCLFDYKRTWYEP